MQVTQACNTGADEEESPNFSRGSGKGEVKLPAKGHGM